MKTALNRFSVTVTVAACLLACALVPAAALADDTEYTVTVVESEEIEAQDEEGAEEAEAVDEEAEAAEEDEAAEAAEAEEDAEEAADEEVADEEVADEEATVAEEAAAEEEAEAEEEEATELTTLETTTVEVDTSVSLVYGVHLQTYGWSYGTASDITSKLTLGTTGQSKRLEAIQLSIDSELSGSITYRVHVQTYGWQSWVSDGTTAGTTGQSKRVEAIQIKLTGELAEYYDVYYRVHVQTYGWLDWACNGEVAGTTGLSKRLEAIQIILVPKGSAAPGDTDVAYVSKVSLTTTVHMQTYGWLSGVSNGTIAGSAGSSKRLEAIQLSLSASMGGGITYSAYVQGVGWQSWVSDGETAGTTGKSKRLEAIKIELTGAVADAYDVWYRVYVQGYGWLDWACNGEVAGTTGLSYRIEAIQVKILIKGSDAPGDTTTPYTTTSLDTDQSAMLAKAQSYSSSTKYLILVNTTTNYVGIYTGSKGSWTEVYYWQCSTGASSTPTVKGQFTVLAKGYSFGSGYTCYYYTQFYGNYLFHSILYNQGTFTVQDGRLGMNISHGCVRLALSSAKWIYDNIPVGTAVVVY